MKYGPIREEADPEQGSGGGAVTAGLPHETGEPTPVIDQQPASTPPTEPVSDGDGEHQGQYPDPQPQPDQTPPQQGVVDLDELVKKLTPPQQQQPVAPQPPVKLTEEQKDELLQRFNVTDDFLLDLFGDADTPAEKARQIKALTAFRDGLVAQATTMADYLVEQKLQTMQQQLAPVMEVAQTQAAQAAEDKFFSTYSAFSTPAHKEAAKRVAQTIDRSKFPDEGDFHKEIATQTETFIKQFDPNFSLANTQKPTQTPTPASQSIGGQGGSGGAPTQKQKVSPQKDAADSLRV